MRVKDVGFCRSSIKSASLIFVLIASAPLGLAQADEFDAFLSESFIREWAIEKVMPAYPEEALKAGISGVSLGSSLKSVLTAKFFESKLIQRLLRY